MIKKVLTIAGSDSGGGAGIQADIKTISALGCHASNVVTAITAQNTLGVEAVESLPAAWVERQLRAVWEDIGADAVKIGMLATVELVETVAALLKTYRPPFVVLDPVLVATSGDLLTGRSAAEAIAAELMPIATVITPNLPEAEQLTGLSVVSEEDYGAVWEAFRSRGARALLLKGGHLTGDTLTDTLFTAEGHRSFTHDRIDTQNTHGTGCTLSSALASYLARGYPLSRAAESAVAFTHRAIAAGGGGG
ncbi:MAG: bifunctional hydroxymethylpyrimidine kinase/phosphomethylpyrimidine kinase, partial [Rikenella sp.]|nr:bifunctional hydroxymethylpyrimidine kinase/phosphomethylpyrimidine kinase [Rikenella sp.]